MSANWLDVKISIVSPHGNHVWPVTSYWTEVNSGSLGKGAVNLADAVLKAVEEPVDFKFLYDVKVSSAG